MTRLDEFSDNTYSQFGEDGVIAHILDVIGEGDRMCVEFGAGDGIECSNTAALWRDRHWPALLIEPDPARFELLESNAGRFDTRLRRSMVEVAGVNSIGAICDQEGFGPVDVMSIDVDGNDYAIFQTLTVEEMVQRPRVVVVEFNPTIPPHVAARQTKLDETFGASLLALIRLGESIGYRFVGATYCNAFFVNHNEAAPFNDYITDPSALQEPGTFTYLVSDFAGRTVLMGAPPPWGTKEPYVLPVHASTNVIPVTESMTHLRLGFESVWGPALLLSPNGLTPQRLRALLSGERHVCVDLSTADLDATAWIATEAEALGFESLLVGRLLGLHRGGTAHA